MVLDPPLDGGGAQGERAWQKFHLGSVVYRWKASAHSLADSKIEIPRDFIHRGIFLFAQTKNPGFWPGFLALDARR